MQAWRAQTYSSWKTNWIVRCTNTRTASLTNRDNSLRDLYIKTLSTIINGGNKYDFSLPATLFYFCIWKRNKYKMLETKQKSTNSLLLPLNIRTEFTSCSECAVLRTPRAINALFALQSNNHPRTIFRIGRNTQHCLGSCGGTEKIS